MEFIKNTLACSYCGKTLQSPVTLPCGITICKHHIIEEEKQFDCIECDKIHPIPSEGFQINKKLDQLLKSELNNLYFGEEYQTAVDALKNLEKSIDSYRLLKQDPSYELDKVFGNLKGDIEFKREHLKLEIDTEAELLIKQVVDYENECKKNIAELDFKRVDEKVEQIEADLKNSKEDLKKLVIDKSKWKVIQASLEGHSKALNEEFKIIRTSLFLYKLDIYQREKKLDLFVGNSPNLRKFAIKFCDCKDYVNLPLKQFEYSFFDPMVNINWKFLIEFSKKSEESSIGLFLGWPKIFESGYKAKITLKIVNRKDRSKDLVCRPNVVDIDLDEKYSDGYGQKLITYAKLKNNKDLYDSSDDSFVAEVSIHSVLNSHVQM